MHDSCEPVKEFREFARDLAAAQHEIDANLLSRLRNGQLVSRRGQSVARQAYSRTATAACGSAALSKRGSSGHFQIHVQGDGVQGEQEERRDTLLHLGRSGQWIGRLIVCEARNDDWTKEPRLRKTTVYAAYAPVPSVNGLLAYEASGPSTV